MGGGARTPGLSILTCDLSEPLFGWEAGVKGATPLHCAVRLHPIRIGFRVWRMPRAWEWPRFGGAEAFVGIVNPGLTDVVNTKGFSGTLLSLQQDALPLQALHSFQHNRHNLPQPNPLVEPGFSTKLTLQRLLFSQ
jgi:hypothetical protein